MMFTIKCMFIEKVFIYKMLWGTVKDYIKYLLNYHKNTTNIGLKLHLHTKKCKIFIQKCVFFLNLRLGIEKLSNREKRVKILTKSDQFNLIRKKSKMVSIFWEVGRKKLLPFFVCGAVRKLGWVEGLMWLGLRFNLR